MKNQETAFSKNELYHDTIRKDIRKCFSDVAEFNDAEIESAMALIAVQSFKKGEHLLREGDICAKSFAIVTGCVRQYYLVDGEEKTTFFYTEGQSIFLPNGPADKIASKYFLSFVEDTTLSVITLENQIEMFKQFPILESMSRHALQEELHNYQEMLSTYITTNPEERYLNLLKFRPELLNRVPQYQLASYLGVTPESLSRIRKRIFLK